MQKAIAYYRVSTGKQGRSGLSLEAQQLTVSQFVKANNFKLVEEFVEINSGRRNWHYALKTALDECTRQEATLVIAKLDRLSRNVAFISTLMEAKNVQFKVVDNPNADKIILHILAAFAEHECEQIRKRTKAALSAAKLRGVELGYYGSHVLSKINHENAMQFALMMKPVIDSMKERGIVTIRAITGELNRLHIPTFRRKSCKWHSTTVHSLVNRLKDK